MVPPKQVGNTADTATNHIVSPSQSTLVLSDEHSNEPKITSKPELFIDHMLGIVPTNDLLNVMPNLEISRRYKFPPTSTRGIPPRDMI